MSISIIHFYKLDNKVLLKEIKSSFNWFSNLKFNDLIDLMTLIMFFILILAILVHTVSKIGMHGLLYILTY